MCRSAEEIGCSWLQQAGGCKYVCQGSQGYFVEHLYVNTYFKCGCLINSVESLMQNQVTASRTPLPPHPPPASPTANASAPLTSECCSQSGPATSVCSTATPVLCCGDADGRSMCVCGRIAAIRRGCGRGQTGCCVRADGAAAAAKVKPASSIMCSFDEENAIFTICGNGKWHCATAAVC
jgi:hypothetical protein